MWKTYVGEVAYQIKCWCCRKQLIKFDGWECGHVVSDKEGGEPTIKNLRPVCGACNSSMGATNMMAFMTKFGTIAEEYEFYDYGTCAGLEEYVEGAERAAPPPPKRRADAAGPDAGAKAKEVRARKAREFADAMGVVAAATRMTVRDGGTLVCLVAGRDIAALWKAVVPWEGNRPIDERRARWLAKAEKRLKETQGRYEFSSPPTTLGLYGADLFLIDGQHRHRAFELLGAPPDSEWLIHVVKCSSLDMVAQHFEWLNSGTPVPPGYYDKQIRETIDEALALVARQWPDILAEGKTRRPKLTRVDARNALSEVRAVYEGIRFGQLTADGLYGAVFAANERQAGIYEDDPGLEKSRTCLEAAKKKGFFLGLVDNWAGQVGAEISAQLRGEDDDDDPDG